MNAYIASFMLLVFNAVGFATPATDAVAAERIAPNAKSNLAERNIAQTSDASVLEQADQCSSPQSSGFNHLDHKVCILSRDVTLLPIATGEHGDTKVISLHSPVHKKLADKRHVEGAP
ncbi:MAG: hypothetical protein ABJN65_01670 [Parasphingorhabdus sp.]